MGPAQSAAVVAGGVVSVGVAVGVVPVGAGGEVTAGWVVVAAGGLVVVVTAGGGGTEAVHRRHAGRDGDAQHPADRRDQRVGHRRGRGVLLGRRGRLGRLVGQRQPEQGARHPAGQADPRHAHVGRTGSRQDVAGVGHPAVPATALVHEDRRDGHPRRDEARGALERLHQPPGDIGSILRQPVLSGRGTDRSSARLGKGPGHPGAPRPRPRGGRRSRGGRRPWRRRASRKRRGWRGRRRPPDGLRLRQSVLSGSPPDGLGLRQSVLSGSPPDGDGLGVRGVLDAGRGAPMPGRRHGGTLGKRGATLEAVPVEAVPGAHGLQRMPRGRRIGDSAEVVSQSRHAGSARGPPPAISLITRARPPRPSRYLSSPRQPGPDGAQRDDQWLGSPHSHLCFVASPCTVTPRNRRRVELSRSAPVVSGRTASEARPATRPPDRRP